MFVDSVQVVGVGAIVGCGRDSSQPAPLRTMMARIARRIDMTPEPMQERIRCRKCRWCQDHRMMIRMLAACALTLCVAGPTRAQERAPNGQIYGELLPFVGLEGVRVEVFGLRGMIFNIPGASSDPVKEATGLSQTERDALHRAIVDNIADAFRRRGVPLLGHSEQSPDVTPQLHVEIAWSRIKSDTVVINITTRLLEAARLLKAPSKITWAQTWGSGLSGYPASPESLAKEIQRLALGGVTNFLELYTRAHAR